MLMDGLVCHSLGVTRRIDSRQSARNSTANPESASIGNQVHGGFILFTLCLMEDTTDVAAHIMMQCNVGATTTGTSAMLAHKELHTFS